MRPPGPFATQWMDAHMQAHSDLALLQQWRQHQDAHAFRALTQRYGGLVFGVCNRVLKNPSDAEEITQDCFLKLARHPEKVSRSVGPWLHSVAVNAALDRMRSDQRRRAREAVYLKDKPSEIEYDARDLLEHVDEAIHQLPEAHRHCVVAWFLEGKPRQEVADELGVSTKTIQRKTDEAIDKIRDFLGKRGITTSAVALGTALTGLKADAMPLALDLALGKIAVAGNLDTATRAAAVQGTTIGGTGMIKAAGIIAALVAVVSGIAWWSSTVPAKERVAESIPVRTLESSAATAPTIETPSKASTVESEATTEAPNGDSSNPAPLGRELFDITPIPNPTRYASLRGTVTDSAERRIVPGIERLQEQLAHRFGIRATPPWIEGCGAVARPTVLLQKFANVKYDRRQEAAELEWAALCWPHHLDAFFASGLVNISLTFDWSTTKVWPEHAFLTPLFEPDRPFSLPAAMLVCLSLCAPPGDLSRAAIDVLVEGIADGRVHPAPFAEPALRIAETPWFQFGRFTTNLAEVARVSPHHAWAVRGLLEALIPPWTDLPKNSHHALELLLELLTQLGQPLEPATREVLGLVKAGGKSGKLVKQLLALGAIDNGAMESAREAMLAARVARAERWAAAPG